MSPFMKAWGKAMQEGDTPRAQQIIEEMSPILESTSWFLNYRGKVTTFHAHDRLKSARNLFGADRALVPCLRIVQVQGSLSAACQANHNGECVAVCVEGGPVTRVEHLLMDKIVQNVHIRGKEANITIKRLTFEQLRQEIMDACDIEIPPANMKREPLGVDD